MYCLGWVGGCCGVWFICVYLGFECWGCVWGYWLGLLGCFVVVWVGGDVVVVLGCVVGWVVVYWLGFGWVVLVGVGWVGMVKKIDMM